MTQEIWKDIQGYETLYAVSNFGRVKSFDRGLRSKGGCINWETEIDKALDKITALEQKDVK